MTNPPNPPIPTPIYHFTHIDNLSELIRTGGILCKNQMSQQNKSYKSSAHESIQNQRSIHPVPVEPGGTIHDYVPFYFNSLSPMLYTIKCGNISGVEIQDLVFFKSTAQAVQQSGKAYAFTDGHGIMALSEYYNQLSDLDQVPWNVINAKYWKNFTDGSRLRQSEFLVYEDFQWELVESIGVYNVEMKEIIIDLIKNLSYQPKVEVKRDWYF